MFNMIFSVIFLFLAFVLPPTFSDQVYPGPPDKSPEAFSEWWSTFQVWRDEISSGLDLALYDNPDVQWASTSFVQPQLMIHDRFISYDI